MKIYDTFDEFWRDYFSNGEGQQPFDTWAIAQLTHTDDQTYQDQRARGSDQLGYQPTMVTLADPRRQRKDEIMLKNLTTPQYEALRTQYQQRFISQLPARFGLFETTKKPADAVYDSWDAFTKDWFEKEGQDTLTYNLPLLFDHVSDAEYWGWQQKGFDPYGTQRLILTIFQYRTGRFADVFITNVTDAEMSRIKMLMQSRLTLRAAELF